MYWLGLQFKFYLIIIQHKILLENVMAQMPYKSERMKLVIVDVIVVIVRITIYCRYSAKLF